MFDKIGISVQGNFVRRQEGVLLRKSGRKLKSLFYLTIIVVLCIFLGGCNKKGEITFEQAADEVFSEEISNQSGWRKCQCYYLQHHRNGRQKLTI